MIEKLKELVKAQGNEPFVYFNGDDANELVKLGYAQVNNEMVDENELIATRVSEEGLAALTSTTSKSLFDQASDADGVVVPVAAQEPTGLAFARKFIASADLITKKALAKGIGIDLAAAKNLIAALIETGELVPGKLNGRFEFVEQVELEPVVEQVDSNIDRGNKASIYHVDESDSAPELNHGLGELVPSKLKAAFCIDNDVPVPTKRKRISGFPNLGLLDIGQSFWFAIDVSLKDPKSSIASRVTRWKKDGILNPDGFDFTTLRVDETDVRGEGIRVWRIS